jgi:pimeloyl-ACP methyl ester carboxylesterase
MIQTEPFELTGSDEKPIFGDITYDDLYTNPATIIFVHGFKGFKDWGAHHLTASFFASNGYRFIKFNLSHSGVAAKKPNDVTDLNAFAENTVSKEMFDLNQVINEVANRYPESEINLIGHSRGGALAILQTAADQRIRHLITWSAIADFSSLWKKEQEAEWMATGKIYVENARTKEKMPLNSTLLEDFNAHKSAFNVLKAAEKVKSPWLILHGDDDINVKFSVAQQLAQHQIKAKIQKIAGANHVYGASHPYASTTLPQHLKQVLELSLAFLK